MREAAIDLCDGRLVVSHEGGYSPYVVPFCGLALIETLAHHDAVLRRAVELLDRTSLATWRTSVT